MVETQELSRVRLKLLRGLADPSRMTILQALRGGARNVSELVAETGLTQSNVSMHLSCLSCCGLVERAMRGKFAYYSLNAKPKFERALRALDALLEGVADRISACSNYRDQ